MLPDSLKSAKLTAEWEAKLSKIEKGSLNPDAFLEEIENFIRRTLLNEGNSHESISRG